MSHTLRIYASFVKLEHAVFALPLLIGGAFFAAGGWPGWWILSLVLVAGMAARIVGFALNRMLDWKIDAKNPRTANRELPSGQMSMAEAWGILICAILIYVMSAALISPFCLLLSPLPLLIFAIYPLLKRFTWLCHLGVGLALALAPLAAGVAVLSRRMVAEDTWAVILSDPSWIPLLFLFLFTLFWVSGFDIIYSTLDEAFDRQEGVHSLPARFGRVMALRVSGVLHVAAFVCMGMLFTRQFGTPVAGGLLLAIAGLLFWEQRKSDNVDLAFFKINGIISFVVLAFLIAGVKGL